MCHCFVHCLSLTRVLDKKMVVFERRENIFFSIHINIITIFDDCFSHPNAYFLSLLNVYGGKWELLRREKQVHFSLFASSLEYFLTVDRHSPIPIFFHLGVYMIGNGSF